MDTCTYKTIMDHLLINIVKVEDIHKDKKPAEYMELVNAFMLNVMDLCKNNTTQEYFLQIAEAYDKTKAYLNDPDLVKQLELAQNHIFIAYKQLNGILTMGSVLDPTDIGECQLFYHPDNRATKVSQYRDTLQNAKKLLNGYAEVSSYIQVETLSNKDFNLVVNYLCAGKTNKDAEDLITYFNTFKPSEKRDALSGCLTMYTMVDALLLDEVNNNSKKIDKMNAKQAANYLEDLYQLRAKNNQ